VRKVLIIAWCALTRLARDKKALIILLLMPMVLIGILGAAIGNMMDGGGLQAFPVVVVNADQPAKMALPPGTPPEVADKLPVTDLGKMFINDILGSQQVKEILEVTTETDLAAAKDLVTAGKAVCALYVPPTFSADVLGGKASAVEIYGDPGDPTRTQLVAQIARSFTEEVTTASLAAQVIGPDQVQQFLHETEEQLPNVTVTTAGTKRVKAIQYYSAAMAIMFMVMTAFSRAKDILQERHDGTLARILVSPTSKAQMIMGQILGNMAIVLAQFGILMIGTKLLYQVSWGNWAASITLGTAFALAAAGIGTAAAGIFDDPRTADALTGVIGMIFAALSGSMFPIYLFPEGLKLVAKFVPNYWALQGFLDQMSGLGLSYLWLPVAILGTIGLVTGGVGAWRLASK